MTENKQQLEQSVGVLVALEGEVVVIRFPEGRQPELGEVAVGRDVEMVAVQIIEAKGTDDYLGLILRGKERMIQGMKLVINGQKLMMPVTSGTNPTRPIQRMGPLKKANRLSSATPSRMNGSIVVGPEPVEVISETRLMAV